MIKTPACLATTNTIAESATVAAEAQGEAKLQSCANVTPPTHRSSEPTRKLFGVVGLASLSLAKPRSASMLTIELGWSEGRIVGLGGGAI